MKAELYRMQAIVDKDPDNHSRWTSWAGTLMGIFVALQAYYTNDRFDEYAELIQDERLGPSRLLLLEPLRRRWRRDPRVAALLEKLSDHPFFKKEIAKLRSRSLKSKAP